MLGQKMQVVFVTLTAELAVSTDLTLALRLWQCHDGGTRGAHAAAAAREEDARSAARAGVGGKGGTEGGTRGRGASVCNFPPSKVRTRCSRGKLASNKTDFD